ncbi:hypothetical protein [Burkholderia pseudomallei]|uniref:hypothetical protein n=1 Tax=Burkholderia pseudomallei TaxID=28450 RepID=UPI00293DFD83|nr:Uncharacterised protein [Burkholderia pseudomallei]CAJ7032592.1 Uncharacterised protein [Burkholderia pseudomallei]CAJ7825387.1 Uncharacterised protein [Burkholderia pseudomallei]
MDWKQPRLFVRQWVRYTIRDAFAQTFGWLTLFGGSVSGFFLAKFGVSVTDDQFTNNVVVAVGGFVIGVGVYAIVGFFKTLRHMQPLALSITDDVRSSGSTLNDQFRSYNVAAIVRNRSDVHVNNCTAYVMNAPQNDGSIGMRFIEKFDMPPKSEKTVDVAYWTSREPPCSDDPDIGLVGPPGNGWGGNACRVPGPETNLHIRIDPHGKGCQDLRCRVWIDTTARRLRAESLPD